MEILEDVTQETYAVTNYQQTPRGRGHAWCRTDDSGRGVERMFYSAYGEPECFPFGDVDGDYVVDNDDIITISAIIGTLVSSNIIILAEVGVVVAAVERQALNK